jgi:uncharacterized protein
VSVPFMWFDLASSDSGTAAEFYKQMFGWDVADAGVGGYRSWIGGGSQPCVRPGTDGPAGTSVTIADPGGAQLALFKPHASP